MKKRTLIFAFYKNSKTLFGRGIRLKQKIENETYWRYSHVEIVKDGVFYSASEVDGGVRKKRIVDNKNNWDYVSISCTQEEYTEVMEYIESRLGDDYDRVGIFFAQVLKTMWFLHPEREFCSEFCTQALHQIGKLCGIPAYSVSPARLRKLLNNIK